MKYASAPYNFIPFDEVGIERYKSIDEIPKHNSTDKKLLSGEITYELVNETPIFVGEVQGDDFFTLPKVDGESEGKKAIPASTIKGLIRSNMQILGKGFFKEGEDFVDVTLLYRNMFGKDILGEKYKSRIETIVEYYKTETGATFKRSTPMNVKAGYIKVYKKEYYLVGTELDNQFDDIFIDNEKDAIRKTRENNYFLINRNSKIPFIKKYAYEHNVSVQVKYRLDSGMLNVIDVVDINAATSAEYKKGYLVAPGEQASTKQEPNHLYIFPWHDEEQMLLKLKARSSEIYEFDYEQKKSTLKGKAKHAHKLPTEEDGYKPFFYTNIGDLYCFSFCKYMRIPFDYSVSQGIPKGILLKENDIRFDYAHAILGFTNKSKGKDTAFASRVKFGHAILQKPTHQVKYNLIPGRPSISNYFDYIIQDDKGLIKSYSTKGFKMRGFKTYWLKDFKKSSLDKMVASEGRDGSSKVIDSGATFEGKIYFKNLNEDELGLLLWALTLGKGKKQIIGKGKPFGMGRVRVENVKLMTDADNKYSLDGFFDDSKKISNIDAFIKAYKDYVKNNYKITLDTDAIVKDFLYIHENMDDPEENSKGYMTLKEYQNRKQLEGNNEYSEILVLPTIRDFVKTDYDNLNKEEEAQLYQNSLQALRNMSTSKKHNKR